MKVWLSHIGSAVYILIEDPKSKKTNSVRNPISGNDRRSRSTQNYSTYKNYNPQYGNNYKISIHKIILLTSISILSFSFL